MQAVFIADTHIRKDPSDNRVIAAHLAKLDPACWLVIAGDLTDNGFAAEYAEALRLLTPWKGRCVLAPGNHDCAGIHGLRWSEKAAARWAKFTQDMEAVGELHLGEWLICALDSVNSHTRILELAQGELGEAELARAREMIQLGHQAGHKVCLTLHHNPVDDPRACVRRPLTDAESRFLNWAEKLRDSSEFLDLAYGGEGADLIICGHTHMHMEWTATRGIPTHMISLGDFRGGEDSFFLG